MKYKRLTLDKLNDQGVTNLLEEIVSCTRQDFISAYISMMDNMGDKKAVQSYENMKDYIRSQYFCALTGLNGEDIVRVLEKECSQIWRRIANAKVHKTG